MRFERMTRLRRRCSIQLSYGTILNCGAKGTFFVKVVKKLYIKNRLIDVFTLGLRL